MFLENYHKRPKELSLKDWFLMKFVVVDAQHIADSILASQQQRATFMPPQSNQKYRMGTPSPASSSLYGSETGTAPRMSDASVIMSPPGAQMSAPAQFSQANHFASPAPSDTYAAGAGMQTPVSSSYCVPRSPAVQQLRSVSPPSYSVASPASVHSIHSQNSAHLIDPNKNAGYGGIPFSSAASPALMSPMPHVSMSPATPATPACVDAPVQQQMMSPCQFPPSSRFNEAPAPAFAGAPPFGMAAGSTNMAATQDLSEAFGAQQTNSVADVNAMTSQRTIPASGPLDSLQRLTLFNDSQVVDPKSVVQDAYFDETSAAQAQQQQQQQQQQQLLSRDAPPPMLPIQQPSPVPNYPPPPPYPSKTDSPPPFNDIDDCSDFNLGGAEMTSTIDDLESNFDLDKFESILSNEEMSDTTLPLMTSSSAATASVTSLPATSSAPAAGGSVAMDSAQSVVSAAAEKPVRKKRAYKKRVKPAAGGSLAPPNGNSVGTGFVPGASADALSAQQQALFPMTSVQLEADDGADGLGGDAGKNRRRVRNFITPKRPYDAQQGAPVTGVMAADAPAGGELVAVKSKRGRKPKPKPEGVAVVPKRKYTKKKQAGQVITPPVVEGATPQLTFDMFAPSPWQPPPVPPHFNMQAPVAMQHAPAAGHLQPVAPLPPMHQAPIAASSHFPPAEPSAHAGAPATVTSVASEPVASLESRASVKQSEIQTLKGLLEFDGDATDANAPPTASPAPRSDVTMTQQHPNTSLNDTREPPAHATADTTAAAAQQQQLPSDSHAIDTHAAPCTVTSQASEASVGDERQSDDVRLDSSSNSTSSHATVTSPPPLTQHDDASVPDNAAPTLVNGDCSPDDAAQTELISASPTTIVTSPLQTQPNHSDVSAALQNGASRDSVDGKEVAERTCTADGDSDATMTSSRASDALPMQTSVDDANNDGAMTSQAKNVFDVFNKEFNTNMNNSSENFEQLLQLQLSSAATSLTSSAASSDAELGDEGEYSDVEMPLEECATFSSHFSDKCRIDVTSAPADVTQTALKTSLFSLAAIKSESLVKTEPCSPANLSQRKCEFANLKVKLEPLTERVTESRRLNIVQPIAQKHMRSKKRKVGKPATQIGRHHVMRDGPVVPLTKEERRARAAKGRTRASTTTSRLLRLQVKLEPLKHECAQSDVDSGLDQSLSFDGSSPRSLIAPAKLEISPPNAPAPPPAARSPMRKKRRVDAKVTSRVTRKSRGRERKQTANTDAPDVESSNKKGWFGRTAYLPHICQHSLHRQTFKHDLHV